jgi:hypothetical protein
MTAQQVPQGTPIQCGTYTYTTYPKETTPEEAIIKAIAVLVEHVDRALNQEEKSRGTDIIESLAKGDTVTIRIYGKLVLIRMEVKPAYDKMDKALEKSMKKPETK